MANLEQEVKLEVPPGWSVPNLDGVIPGARAEALPVLKMEATYYDTADLRLARQKITLRLRQESEEGEARAGQARLSGRCEWTLKLPGDGQGNVLARHELTWPATVLATGARRRLKAEPAALVKGVALGRPLVPVALISTVRRRTVLRTSDGRALAEVDYDTVIGHRIDGGGPGSTGTGPGGGLAGTAVDGEGTQVRFEEVEVELVGGSALEVLEAVVARLCHAGARPSQKVSKLKTVLGEVDRQNLLGKAPGGAALDSKRLQGGRGTKPKGGRPGRDRPLVLADILAQQAGACLSELLGQDVALRTGPAGLEPVHRARVAVRRFRTVLRSFQRYIYSQAPELPAVPAGWLANLSAELRWFSGVLGEARDAEVRLRHLQAEHSQLPAEDSGGAEVLLATATAEEDAAYRRLLAAMDDARYLGALRRLEALCRPGEGSEVAQVRDRLTAAAGPGLRRMARKEWRSLRKTMDRLNEQASDEALHRARVKAKRVRYLAELFKSAGGGGRRAKASRTTVAYATAVQDLLGAVHDDAVYAAWLRSVATHAPEGALVAGQLLVMADQRRVAARRQWPVLWQKLASEKVTGWLD